MTHHEPATDPGSISDGFHTFAEMYEARMLLHAYAARYWLDQGHPVVKSLKHADGEYCFGPNSGWFIVTAQLPTGQVSNHYPTDHWDLFQVPEVELPPEWDGHDTAAAAARMHAHLTGQEPTP